MLKFSKNSWHYKVYSLFKAHNTVPPSNFCNYFWVVIATSLAFLAAFGFIIMVLIGMVTIFFFKNDILSGLGATGWLVIFILSVFYAGHLIDKYFRNRRRKKLALEGYREKVVKPSFFVEWWKAFKGKYCPKITWEESK